LPVIFSVQIIYRIVSYHMRHYFQDDVAGLSDK